ncbi:NicO-domain-containing protein [Meira miltonrushii]|uniref:Nickel/cobalt efflux system n=1 Tax=Meira miltonrushii TaxID=1280837 RepID=A0A316V5T8_9BASI|nr:NicO-domain-containing protein [Meira miltonrushii]PWN32947.1 NicO-domain-containing protein [Meira miltonrushii]
MAVREVLDAVERRKRSEKKLSLMARTILLILAEILVNALLWIITAIVFLKGPGDGHRILGLALVAWTTGLRHGLDADHISAIDNAIRRIVSVPQMLTISSPNGDNEQISCMRRPVTVGLFFSLGHSTIVFAATVAIAISAGVANNFDGFGNVGGIIGASISGSFLILIGCINAVILYKTVRRLQVAKKKAKDEEVNPGEENHRFNGIITRVAMPILRSVDRPWKMYPVGVLFGLGFDTASSIALLSVAVIAQQQQRKNAGTEDSSNDASVILLALLFTAGMTLVDSADSCLMIWAYAPDLPKKSGWRERLAIWRDKKEIQSNGALQDTVNIHKDDDKKEQPNETPPDEKRENEEPEKVTNELNRVSLDASASRISLVLTLLSILVAFAIGLIVLMGLIGEQCSQCTRAADEQEETGNGGLAGRWWLAWRTANDNSGYVGAGIVGTFAVSVILWYFIRYTVRKLKSKKASL